MLLARLRRGRVRGHAVPRAGLSTGSSFRTAAPPQGDRWREEVEAKLSKVLDPVLGRSVVDLEMVFDIAQKGGGPPEDHETWESLMEPSVVEVTLALPTGAYPEREALVQAVGEAVASVRWVDRAVVLTRYARPRPPPTVNRTKLLTGLRHVGSLVAVYSCKGGVGKSTVATNLAYSLAARGGRVGIFDADVYGPSLPAMVSPTDTSIRSTDGKLLLPIEYEGVKCMSYGWAAGPSEEGADDAGTGSGRATVARGAIVSGTIVQLLGETDWGELDYLILDLPPGTGDIQLTLTQQITPPITAAVVVSTPHHLAHIDALKGVDMFERTAVPTVAVVENMAYFDGDDGKRYYPFGPGHAVELAEACGLSSDHAITLPILPAVATASGGGESGGHPYVLEQPGSEVAALYDTLSEGLVATLLKHHHTANADQGGSAVPKILIVSTNRHSPFITSSQGKFILMRKSSF